MCSYGILHMVEERLLNRQDASLHRILCRHIFHDLVFVHRYKPYFHLRLDAITLLKDSNYNFQNSTTILHNQLIARPSIY